MKDPLPESDDNGHIVVCGYGNLGRRIVCLLRQIGARTSVVSMQLPANPGADDGNRWIEGDAREERFLLEAGVRRAKAVLAATHDDMTNVAIAVEAKRLNPNICVVIRLFDQDLGAHLEQSLGIQRALSASALAAPVFVAAAMGGSARGAFELEDRLYYVDEHRLDEPGFDPSAAPWTADAGSSIVAIARDRELFLDSPDAVKLQAGDRVACIRRAGGGVSTPAREASSRNKTRFPLHTALKAGIHNWWREAPRGIQWAIGLFFCVVAFSVALFHWTMNLPVVDALYFVATIISTVGFGDYNLMNAHPALKLYGAFLMICGAAILAVLFSIISDLVLSARFRNLLSRGCASFENHIIIAGLGSIGFRVLRDLADRGEIVVAIENNEKGRFLESSKCVAPVIQGDARMKETLEKAGIRGAKAVVAVTDEDIANISVVLAAKRHQPAARTVLRLFDAELAAKMQPCLGVDAVLSVSAAAAPTFVAAALFPDAIHGFILGDYFLIICRKAESEGIKIPCLIRAQKLRNTGARPC